MLKLTWPSVAARSLRTTQLNASRWADRETAIRDHLEGASAQVVAPRAACRGLGRAPGDRMRSFQGSTMREGRGVRAEVVAGGGREPRAWDLTGLADGRGQGLVSGSSPASAVVPRAAVAPVACGQAVVPRARAFATAIVVPMAAASRGDDTAAAKVVPVERAKQGRASRVVSRHSSGSETRIATGQSGSSVVLLLEQAVPVELTAPCRSSWVGVRRASEVVAAPVVLLASVESRQPTLARVLPLASGVPAPGARSCSFRSWRAVVPCARVRGGGTRGCNRQRLWRAAQLRTKVVQLLPN